MGSTSTTFTLTVTAQQQTTLGQLVADMQAARPDAPMWCNELPGAPEIGSTTINATIGPKFGDGIITGPTAARPFYAFSTVATPYELLPGAGGPANSHYDPTHNQWWFVSGTTGITASAQTIVRYSVATDTFEHLQGSGPLATDGPWHPYGGAHNFGSSDISVSRRRLYRFLFATSQGDPYGLGSNYGLFYADIDSTGNTIDRGFIGNAGTSGGLYIPMVYYPEMDSLLAFFGVTNPAQIRRFSLADNSLKTDMPTVAFSGLPAVVYCNGAVYATGNAPSVTVGSPEYKAFYKIETTTISRVADTPVQMNMSGYYPENMHTEFVALGTKIYAFHAGDPTGNGAVYSYDTETNAWAGPLDTLPSPHADTSTDQLGFTVAAVPSLNCVLMARKVTNSRDQALVWKP